MLTKWIFPDRWHVMVIAISSIMHQRSAWRLAVIFSAMLLAKGRKTITSWLRAAGISRCYKAFYYCIGSLGNRTENIATELLKIMIQTIYKKGNTVLMAIDELSHVAIWSQGCRSGYWPQSYTYPGREKVYLWPCVGHAVGYHTA